MTAAVEAYLADARPAAGAQPVKAVIAPHAGYQYSGPIAGSAYGSLIPHAKGIERVILVDLPPAVRKIYDSMEEHLLAQIDERTVTAAMAGAAA